MFKEVGLTEDQMKSLKSQREAVKLEKANVMKCKEEVKKFGSLTENHLTSVSTQVQNFQNFLIPK